MNEDRYLYRSEDCFKIYEFVSEGRKGQIKKLVQYTETGSENVYNLAFGDYNEDLKGINDLSVSDNGDSVKVLATVASTVYAFTKKYPEAWIFATGSTSGRTRLYRMGITNNLSEISQDFKIFGLSRLLSTWEEFIIGIDYDAFLLTRKENV